ncbi:MAG TPA: right-handed parallel beta-helix repeat-containing protein, partial [Spirochaetota bacterium]|nr:right-handed parallel beta-helix repeat-containing protein [Spirochaetota bacterium]
MKAEPSATNVHFQWDGVPNALTYDIEIDGVLITGLTVNELIQSIAQPHADISFRVRTNTADAVGEWSDLQTVVCAHIVGGVLGGDTTWDNTGAPYYVTSDFTVPENVTLTIQAGVVILLDPGVKFNVYGNVNILGETGYRSIISSTRDADYGGQGIVSEADYWGGLSVYNYARFSGENLTVLYGVDANTRGMICVTGNLELTNTLLQNSLSSAYGIYADMQGMTEAKLDGLYLLYDAGTVVGQNTDRIAIGGTLATNFVIDDNRYTHVMTQKLIVPDGLALSFTGVGQVLALKTGGIEVYGELNIQGTEIRKTLFTSVFDTSVGGAGITDVNGLWGGILIQSIGGLRATYAEIRYCGYAKNEEEWLSVRVLGSADMSYVTVSDSAQIEIEMSNQTNSITNSLFTNDAAWQYLLCGSGIHVIQTGEAGSFTFTNNSIQGFGDKIQLHLSRSEENPSRTSATCVIEYNQFSGVTEYNILIEDWSTDLNINDSTFSDSTAAAISINRATGKVKLSQNTINRSHDGAYISGLFTDRSVEILNNTISVTKCGVLIESTGSLASAVFYNNTITAGTGLVIRTLGGDLSAVTISDNHVLAVVDALAGRIAEITASGAIGSIAIMNNDVRSTLEGFIIKSGTATGTVTVSANTIVTGIADQWGISFSLDAGGDVNTIEFFSNTMNSSMENIRVNSVGTIGQVLLLENQLIGGWTSGWGRALQISSQSSMNLLKVYKNNIDTSGESINVSTTGNITELNIAQNTISSGSIDGQWGINLTLTCRAQIEKAL